MARSSIGGKKNSKSTPQLKIQVVPTDCPFREFRDHELSPEFWGMNPSQYRSALLLPKQSVKSTTAGTGAHIPWIDEQTQPLPKSVRNYLDGWVRAEELAEDRWDCEVVVSEEHMEKMSAVDYQLTHAQVLVRSSFCRRVLSACFMLERVEILLVEHQWENFNFSFGPEGWRPKCHIYSPGMKAGGGSQHKPGLSKNGCYLVRVYYLGAWRCIWVSDQVPVDASGAPLLPFSPLSSPAKSKSKIQAVMSNVVHLWPLLLCKALLKIASPDINDDDLIGQMVEDEDLEIDIMHSLTGCLSVFYDTTLDYDEQWKLLVAEAHNFTWDGDDDMLSSTAKSRSTKKSNTKDRDGLVKKAALVSVLIQDTKDYPPYALPGITPGHEMSLIVTMVRDVPLKKPLPEPEVALWKTYRWVDWARRHGLYEAYDCPRTKYVRVNGLMKLSYAPHLIDVQSTESITYGFLEMNKHSQHPEKSIKKIKEIATKQTAQSAAQAMKEELREWNLYENIQPLIKSINVVFYPSLFNYASAGSNPPVRITKVVNKNVDIQAPSFAPLYLSIDGPEENILRISLTMLHPRILMNTGSHIEDYIEKAYVLLECFEWFVDKDLPLPKAYVQTRGYDSVEVKFPPGRHYCRLWVHSRMNWHLAMLSESTIVLGTRDVVQLTAVHECPWAAKFLNYLGASFTNWIRSSKSIYNYLGIEQDFYSSYQPDLEWDSKVVGYSKKFVHWMFREALDSHFYKRLVPNEYKLVCAFLRHYFCDPDFGLPPKPDPPSNYRDVADRDPCDCTEPEAEEPAAEEEAITETLKQQDQETKKPTDFSTVGEEVFTESTRVVSNVCGLVSEEQTCSILKDKREKIIRKHEAATRIQAFWRGVWVRKVLTTPRNLTSEVMKILMDNAFGNLEVLSVLMNEFFLKFPGAKYAYSISSALSGVYGLDQHYGVSQVSGKCKWIPYFQGIFYCHMPLKVHLDVICSTIGHSMMQVYDNDNRTQMPQVNNAPITLNFEPNQLGYTVMGHGTLIKPLGYHSEAHWQLTVMTSIDNVFHICDNNETELCNLLTLTPAFKLHIDEIYIPNRRNILGGISISVTKVEAVSFRAAASSPDLEMIAILKAAANEEHDEEEIARCHGKGEIFWPYIPLRPFHYALLKRRSFSTGMLQSGMSQGYLSARSLKNQPQTKPKLTKLKSSTKLHVHRATPQEAKTYIIEVIAPNGWALSLNQWKRVDEVRNDIEVPKSEPPIKVKTAKDRVGSARERRDKDKEQEKFKVELEKPPIFTVHQPHPEDAYIELECSTTVGGGAYAKRDDDRDIQFALAIKSWDAKEHGRNNRGAQIRQAFRDEFLVTQPAAAKSESGYDPTSTEDLTEEEWEGEHAAARIRPSPVTESALLECVEPEEDLLYYTMPEQLRDKFIPLYFVPLCTREKLDEPPTLLTEGITEAAKNDRQMQVEMALERMRELQKFNETHILGRQKMRCQLLEGLGVDSTWNPDLATVLEERDEAIAREVLDRQVSASRKRQEQKLKQDTKQKPETNRNQSKGKQRKK